MVSYRTVQFLATGAVAAALSLPSVLPFSSQTLHSLGLLSVASAKDPIRYKPSGRPGPIRTAGTGARGCGDANKPTDVMLMPLVPDRHIGQTVSARPTFYWYAKGAQAVEFALVQPGVNKPILEQHIPVTKTGIVKLEIPASAPELAIGKQYRWSVSVACNLKRRSEDIAYTQTFIQRVPLSPQLEQQLAAAKTPEARARAYAEASVWYDALATLSKASTAQPTNQAVSDSLVSLLDQVGLTPLIAQGGKVTWAANPGK